MTNIRRRSVLAGAAAGLVAAPTLARAQARYPNWNLTPYRAALGAP